MGCLLWREAGRSKCPQVALVTQGWGTAWGEELDWSSLRSREGGAELVGEGLRLLPRAPNAQECCWVSLQGPPPSSAGLSL